MHRQLVIVISALAVMFTVGHGSLHAQVAPFPEARYMPAKTIVGVQVQPGELLKNPELQKLYKLAQTIPQALPESEMGVELTAVDRVVMSLTKPEVPLPDGNVVIRTILIRAKDAAMLKTISEKMIPANFSKKQLSGTTSEARIAPIPNIQIEGRGRLTAPEEREAVQARVDAAAAHPDAWKRSTTFVHPDERTILTSQYGAEVANVLKQMQSGAAAPAWAKQFDSAARYSVAGLVDLNQVRELMKAFTAARPPQGADAIFITMLSPVWEKADLAVFALDTRAGLKLSIVVHSADAESARAVKNALDGFLPMIEALFLPFARSQSEQLNALQPRLGDQLYGDLEKAVNELTITQTETTTELTFALPQQTLGTIAAAASSKLEKSKAVVQDRCEHNLKTLALAMHNYIDDNRAFPAANQLKKEGQPPHSWRIALLPYIDEQKLYDQYKFDEPWDSEANKKVLNQVPEIYRSPNGDPRTIYTSYVVPTFEKGMFTEAAAMRGFLLRRAIDGLSKTLLIVETETSIPWTKPEDLPIDPAKPFPASGFAKSATLNVAFADGSVYRLSKNPAMELLLPFLTPRENDTGDLDKLLAPAPSGALAPPRPAPNETKALPVEGIAP